MNTQTQPTSPVQPQAEVRTKFCKFCGSKIPEDAIVCNQCGRQVEELKQAAPAATPNVIINNSNMNTNTNVAGAMGTHPKNKWVAVLLCFFLGFVGAHKFYEGKIGMGILYIFTMGLFGIGIIVDLILLLLKPNPYYV